MNITPRRLAQLALGFVLLGSCGCIVCGSASLKVVVRGRLLDNESDTAISEAIVGGRISSEGELVAGRAPFTTTGAIQGAVTSEDGSFDLVFSTPLRGCVLGRLAPTAPTKFPTPDRVEFIIVRDGCEQSFFVDINEDTVVDITFPDDVLELIHPILVPACEEADDVAP